MQKIEDLYKLYLTCGKVSTDTRSIEKGSLFIALNGENFNANEFAIKALDSGALYAIIDDPKFNLDGRCILVEDTLKTLQDLAKLHRKNFNHPVLGITGTNGKTTTKELINAVLSQKFEVHATKGNLNNHIGVPLTILGVQTSINFMIVEMGANHIGEIGFLSNISDPDYGVITNIGSAHLEGFGSYENVKKTKLELYNYIEKKSGTLFVNGEDEVLLDGSKNIERILYNNDQNNKGWKMRVDDYGRIAIDYSFNGETGSIKSQLFGSYNFDNLVCAITIGQYFGVNMQDIEKSIEQYQPDNNRSQIIEKNDNLIILDAYNANPSSMTLAIKSFASIPKKNKLVILGDMLELGVQSTEEHQKIVDLLVSENLSNCYLVGAEFGKINSSHFKCRDVNELIEEIKKHPPKDAAILMKGSRGIKIEQARDYIN